MLLNAVNLVTGWRGHSETGQLAPHAANAVNISAKRSYNPPRGDML